MVENTVGKGGIARYEQFLLSSSVFKRFVWQTRKNQGLFGKGISSLEVTWRFKGCSFIKIWTDRWIDRLLNNILQCFDAVMHGYNVSFHLHWVLTPFQHHINHVVPCLRHSHMHSSVGRLAANNDFLD